jgi:hypothetical protein
VLNREIKQGIATENPAKRGILGCAALAMVRVSAVFLRDLEEYVRGSD